MRGRTPLALGLALAAAAPAAASYGGAPVPAPRARPLVWFATRTAVDTAECSGVLIGRRHVLTAAHCVRDVPSGRPRTPYGDVRIGSGRAAVLARVAGVRVHPRWRPRSRRGGWDLAVLTLDRRVPVRPARLVSSAEARLVRPPAPVVVAGFGITRVGQGLGPRPARAVRLELLSPYNCVGPGMAPAFGRTQVCAASPRAGVCAGDSGAPLLATVRGSRRVAGITSRAIEAAPCAETVGIFSRVAPALGWIRRAAPGAPVPR